MQVRQLGDQGPVVSTFGLGCMGMSQGYGPADRVEALHTLRCAADLGIRFWDTSDVYGLGSNEMLLGEALNHVNRDALVIATKFGGISDPNTGDPLGVRGDAAYVRKACEASLRRLGVEHIDIYYQHLPDPDVPIEETVGAMAELVVTGKVRYLGLSNIAAEQLRQAHAVHPIAAVQEEWSVFSRGVETTVVPTCAELGIGVVAYSPLGRGQLTGRNATTAGLSAEDVRHIYPRFEGENALHNAKLVEQIGAVAKSHGATKAQVALAWVLRQGQQYGATVIPIPGTKNRHRLEENAQALGLTLTDEDLAVLEPIADHVVGDRIPELPPALRRLLPDQ